MKRRAALLGAGSALAAAAARAQTPPRRPRVGVLIPVTEASYAKRFAALRAGLAERGWVEPATLELVLRFADAQADRFPVLARELVAAGPEVIVVASTGATRAAMGATKTIPIVVASATDLLGSGLIASLARPGGNVTGLTLQRMDLGAKEIELLAELTPGLARLAVLHGPTGGAAAQMAALLRAAAAARGIETRTHHADSAAEIDAAFAAMAAERSQAVIVIDGPVPLLERERIARLAISGRLPVLTSSRDYVDAGTLVSYGPNAIAMNRRVGYFVDRILKGAKPADLPVEQPTIFELVINRRTATALGLAVPPTLLIRADEVIE